MMNYILGAVALTGLPLHSWILIILSPIVLLILFSLIYYFGYWKRIRKSDYDVNKRNARIKAFKKSIKNK